MDEVDRAQQRTERELERYIAAARAAGAGDHSDTPICVCVDCGWEIEPARTALGYTVCISCAQDRELRELRGQ